ncbi:MAG: hypothetical protein ACJA2S_001023 [Cyclobacteriaceae bacterium]|jgi:hypothetical protein
MELKMLNLIATAAWALFQSELEWLLNYKIEHSPTTLSDT